MTTWDKNKTNEEKKNRDTYAGSHIKGQTKRNSQTLPPLFSFWHTQRQTGPGLAEALTSVFTVEGQCLVQWGTQNSCQINILSGEAGGEEHWRKCTKWVNTTYDLEVYSHWSHWESCQWQVTWSKCIRVSYFFPADPFLPSSPAKALPLPKRAGKYSREAHDTFFFQWSLFFSHHTDVSHIGKTNLV